MDVGIRKEAERRVEEKVGEVEERPGRGRNT